MQNPDRGKSRFKSHIATIFGVAGAVYLIGSAADLSERIWATLQAYEAFEFDELVIAGISILVAGLVIAFREIADLKAKVKELESVDHRTPTVDSLEKDHVDCVIKCVGCGKYQIQGEEWFSPGELTTRFQQADALGGVCPNCRPPSDH